MFRRVLLLAAAAMLALGLGAGCVPTGAYVGYDTYYPRYYYRGSPYYYGGVRYGVGYYGAPYYYGGYPASYYGGAPYYRAPYRAPAVVPSPLQRAPVEAYRPGGMGAPPPVRGDIRVSPPR